MLAGLLLAFIVLRLASSHEPEALLWLTIGMAIGLFLDRLVLLPVSVWLEQHGRPTRTR